MGTNRWNCINLIYRLFRGNLFILVRANLINSSIFSDNHLVSPFPFSKVYLECIANNFKNPTIYRHNFWFCALEILIYYRERLFVCLLVCSFFSIVPLWCWLGNRELLVWIFTLLLLCKSFKFWNTHIYQDLEIKPGFKTLFLFLFFFFLYPVKF